MNRSIKADKGTIALSAYASGSGALSFVWSETKHPGKSVSKNVTLSDAKRVCNLKANKHLLRDHKLVMKLNQVQLIPIVKRINENTLEYSDRQYFYQKLSKREDGSVIRGLTEYFTNDNGYEIEVMHLSTKSALNYFLDNEDYYNSLQS